MCRTACDRRPENRQPNAARKCQAGSLRNDLDCPEEPFEPGEALGCIEISPGFLGGVSLKQMALWSLNGIDDGLTGRSVASLDFAPDFGIFRPTLAINGGGVYGKGVQDGFVVGPEIRFDVAPVGGFNIGINVGKVAGAGIIEHLHIHIVPRWFGDTNFMPVLASTTVVPQALRELAARLRHALLDTP